MKVSGIVIVMTFAFLFFSGPVISFTFPFFGYTCYARAEDGQIRQTSNIRERRIERVNAILLNRDDIRGLVQGITVNDGAGGPYVEYYGTRIERLADDVLGELATNVNNLLVLKNTENIQRVHRDIVNIQRIQDLNRQQMRIQQHHQGISSRQPFPRTPSPPAQPPSAPAPPPRR